VSDSGLCLKPMDSDHHTILTIGAFDGVHLGHRRLARQVVRRAQQRGCLGGAITFDPHPRTVLAGQGPPCLASLDERLALLHETGLDLAVALPFTRELANLPAREFMHMICAQYRLHELWVGWDFALGRRREGTVARLAEIGGELGFCVHVVPPFYRNGQVVSSTLIRNLIDRGEVEQAARLLGRCHRVRGTLLPGELQGRQPGLTTVVISANTALPADGIYAVRARLGSWSWWTEAHLEPGTLESERQIELSLPAIDRPLPEQSIQLEFLRDLRPTVRIPAARRVAPRVHKGQAQAPRVLNPV
jgi:riboflavin kinase/FMN adenylyltransferase